jgi:predicted transcriptional regulator
MSKPRSRPESAPQWAKFARLFKLAGSPLRAQILLALDEGPRDTTALAEATGRRTAHGSNDLTALRLAGLVESTQAGQRRVHSLTPAGRVLCEAIRKLADE